MGICEDLWASIEVEKAKPKQLLLPFSDFTNSSTSRSSTDGVQDTGRTFPSICIIQGEVVFPSLLVLLFSSVFCCFANALLNVACTSGISYVQSITKRGQEFLQASKQAKQQQQLRYDSPRNKECEVVVTESTHLLKKPLPPPFSPGTFMWDKGSPISSERNFLQRSLDGMDSPLAGSLRSGPLLQGALESSLHGVRVTCQKCFFLLNPHYMTISIFKCLAIIIFIQYHFDFIPGGWQRFCVCGTANVLSATCTPFLEFLNSYLLPVDNFPEEEKDDIISGSKTNKKKIGKDNSNILVNMENDEVQKDSVLIVEILVRIGHLQLTDLTTVLIQGSSFVIFLAIFFPMFMVFGIIGAILSWVIFFFWGVYYLIRREYYRKRLASTSNKIGNRYPPRWVLFMELIKAGGLRGLTIFLVQVSVIVSFMMGLAILDGFSYSQAREFVLNQLFRWHLWSTVEASWYQWITLCSQLFF